MVTFNQIPGALRVPLFYAEINAGGTPFLSSERMVIFGHKTAAGQATENEAVLVPESNGGEDALFGTESMLAQMVRTARANAPFQEIWAVPVAEPAGATSTGSVDLSASAELPATVASTFTIEIAGKSYTAAVSVGDTATDVIDAIKDEIDADPYAPVTTVSAAGVLDITAVHAGVIGDGIKVELPAGIKTPVTASAAVTPMAGGAGLADMSAPLAALGDEDFLWLVSPFADDANLALYTAFMDGVSGRWSPMQQLYGHVVTAREDTVANLSTAGASLNDPHLTVMGYFGSASTPWEWASALGAKVAKHLSDAPELSRPLQFINLEGIAAPRVSDRFSVTDRNVLYFDGIASYRVARDGSVQIDRAITTYKTNSIGELDATYLDVQTLAQAQFAIRYLRGKVLNAHGRKALADDTSPAIDGVSRPRDIRNTLVAGYQELVNLAVVENQEVFEANLVVERDPQDANRVNTYLPMDHVNQLRVVAVNATTYMQYPAEFAG